MLLIYPVVVVIIFIVIIISVLLVIIVSLAPQGPKSPGTSALSTPAPDIQWMWDNLRSELGTFGYEGMVEAALRMADSSLSSSPSLISNPTSISTSTSIPPLPFSIILTVHNMGAHIAQVVEAIFQTTRSEFELIIVYDGCVDDSRGSAEGVVERCWIGSSRVGGKQGKP